MLCNASRVARQAFGRGIRPDPLMLPCEWADNYRVLSQAASAEPGKFRTARTPYMFEPINALAASSRTREVTLMFAAQLAKTEGGNNWIGSVIDITPGPMLAVQPTVDMAKRFSKQRINPMIMETPRLFEKVGETKSRDSSNTMLQKDFLGGTLVMTGANSATGLRSMPVKYLFCDEIDAMPGDVDGEGDPLDLAERRTSTFEHTKKILWTSTPTIAGRSKVEKKYFDPRATQEVYLVPCPECGCYQRLMWNGIQYEDVDGVIKGDVRYKCEECEHLIEERHKTKMLAAGKWEATNKNADGTIRSFHLSSLYSPLGWFSWKSAAEVWLASQGNPDKLRTFVNTILGEVYKEKGDAPEWEQLFARRLTYKPNTIPHEDCMVLTCGVDIQKNRIECEVVGWGPRMQSWSVDYRVFAGDTSEMDVYEKLEEMLNETWTHPGAMPMQITRMVVDAGYNTQTVYAWCRKQPVDRVMAVQGGPDSMQVPVGIPRAVDVDWEGVKVSRGTMYWPVGVGMLKNELYAWLRRSREFEDDGAPKKTPYGWAEFPQYEPEYFKQLCAEELMRKLVRGFVRYEWHKTRDRNEALDCRVYARAGAEVVGLHRWEDAEWEMLRETLGLVTSVGEQVQATLESAASESEEGIEREPARTTKQGKRPYQGYCDRWRGRNQT